jgi:hypothetical protein
METVLDEWLVASGHPSTLLRTHLINTMAVVIKVSIPQEQNYHQTSAINHLQHGQTLNLTAGSCTCHEPADLGTEDTKHIGSSA